MCKNHLTEKKVCTVAALHTPKTRVCRAATLEQVDYCAGISVQPGSSDNKQARPVAV